MLAVASASRIIRPTAVPVVRSALASFSSSAFRADAPPPPTPAPAATKRKASARAPSSLPAGTIMAGLGVMKDGLDPVALADDKYPEWLWTILDDHKGYSSGAKKVVKRAASQEPEGQLKEFNFLEERKRLRVQNRTNIKAANYLKTT